MFRLMRVLTLSDLRTGQTRSVQNEQHATSEQVESQRLLTMVQNVEMVHKTQMFIHRFISLLKQFSPHANTEIN